MYQTFSSVIVFLKDYSLRVFYLKAIFFIFILSCKQTWKLPSNFIWIGLVSGQIRPTVSGFFSRLRKFVGLFHPTLCRCRPELMSSVGKFMRILGCRVFSADDVGNFVCTTRHVSGMMSGDYRVGFFMCQNPDGIGKFRPTTRHASGFFTRHVADSG